MDQYYWAIRCNFVNLPMVGSFLVNSASTETEEVVYLYTVESVVTKNPGSFCINSTMLLPMEEPFSVDPSQFENTSIWWSEIFSQVKRTDVSAAITW